MNPRHRALSLTLLLWFAPGVATHAAGTSAGNPASTPVDSLLRALQAQGIDVIFSSELVPPDMRAPPPRAGRTPLQAASDALSANGLRLEPLAPNRYVVVRAPAPPPLVPADESLEEISVYASRYSIEGRTVAAPRELSGDDIDTTPGSHDDALRALKSLPGMAGNLSARPYIRGSLADDVLVRYDGITLLDPFHLKNYQSLISAIDPAAVARIDVFSGGFPVRYGTRSGGVIDVTPAQIDSGYENRAALSLISAGLSSLGHGDRLPVDWLFALRRSTLDLLDPVEDGLGQPSFGDSLGRVRYRTDHGAWTLGWLLLDDRIELDQNDDTETAKARYRDEYFWLAREHEFSDQLRTRATAVLTASERHRSGLLEQPAVASGALDDDTEFDRFELTNLWTYAPRESITWTLGAEMSASRAEYTYTRRVEYAPAVAAAFARPVTNDLDFSARPEVFTYALHVANRQQWQAFEAELGVRLDGQHYSLGGDHTQFSPRLNLRYDFSDRLRIYASAGRFAQAQHVEEWRAEEAQPEADAAQIAVHTILGVTWEPSPTARWGVEAYSKRWTTVSPYFDNQLDPLSLTPDLAPDRIRITPSQSEASGLELNFRREFPNRVTASGTLSWARVADDIDQQDGAHDVLRSWDQSLALSAGVGWQGARLNLSAFGAWHRGWPRTALRFAQPPSNDALLTLGGRNRQRWGDFYTLDLRASYLWSLAHGDLSAIFEVTNATNRANECCAVLQSAGNGYLEADTDHWLPAIVNLGFTYRWRNRH